MNNTSPQTTLPKLPHKQWWAVHAPFSLANKYILGACESLTNIVHMPMPNELVAAWHRYMQFSVIFPIKSLGLDCLAFLSTTTPLSVSTFVILNGAFMAWCVQINSSAKSTYCWLRTNVNCLSCAVLWGTFVIYSLLLCWVEGYHDPDFYSCII